MSQADREGAISVEVHYEWSVVEAAPGKPYRFPHPVGDEMRERCEGPAVYRWVIEGGPGPAPQTHVGETEDLVRAIAQYRNPGANQQAAARLKREMTEAMLMGAVVRLEVLDVTSLRVDERTYDAYALRNPAVRQLLKGILALRASPGTRKPSAGDLSGLF